ncbi:MAG: ceramidase domain-containing protein [Flavobacteriaceae bacterium]|nr:ceramidase domain-containing protein [Flavobacteriaceae bacterium]
MGKRAKIYVIILTAILGIAILYLIKPEAIPQDPSYYEFADDRKIFGIANFWDLFSNIGFLFVGIWGLLQLNKLELTKWNKINVQLICVGIALTSLGSAYFHYQPAHDSLVWDRIPMTLVFMPFFSFIIALFITNKYHATQLLLLTLIGVLSVLYWIIGEHRCESCGDLRPYALVQFLPMVLIPLILLLFKKTNQQLKYLFLVFIFYGIAKVCETYDKHIFDLLNELLSGHSIKHFMATIATYFLIVWIRKTKAGFTNTL